MHILNKNPSPADKKDGDIFHSSRRENDRKTLDLISYILALSFLTGTFFVFQSFNFTKFFSGILEMSDAVKQNGNFALESVETVSQTLAEQLKYLAGSDKKIDTRIITGTVLRVGETAGEFFTGVKKGINLSRESIEFTGQGSKKLAVDAFLETRRGLVDSWTLANEKVVLMIGDLSADMNGGSVKKIAQISAIGETYQKQLASSTLEVRDLGQEMISDWLVWSHWIVQPGLFPVISASYEKNVFPWRQILNTGITNVLNVSRSISDNASLSWSNFLARFFDQDIANDLSDLGLREQLKKEILQELQNGNTATLKPSSAGGMYSESGIVVMKPLGPNLVDLNNVKKIQDSFSDRVLVNFDQGGETGVIQPIFRDHAGEKYIFVITPVKK